MSTQPSISSALTLHHSVATIPHPLIHPMKTALNAGMARINPIQPGHIDVSNGIWDSIWQHMETEVSAKLLVKFAQKNGGWQPFTKAALDVFSKHDFWFNRLRERDTEVYKEHNQWIVLDHEGVYHYTVEFIAEVYAKAPAKLKEAS